MSLLPKIKKCPHCRAFNLVRINGITYNNEFQILKDWQLKSKIYCRRCKIEVGLFTNTRDKKKEKFIWMDFIRCEETYLKKLTRLEKNKIKYEENDKRKEYLRTIKQIQDIQNEIRLDQIKLKIKIKIQNRLIII